MALSDGPEGGAAEPEPPRRQIGRLHRPLIGPFTGRHLAALAVVLVVAVVGLTVLATPIGAPTPAPPPEPGATAYLVASPGAGLQPGQVAPELSGVVDGQTVQLVDLDGRPIRLADLRGRPVWINFWASWCPPCQQETPILRKVYETHRDQGLVLIGISVQEASPDDVRRYVETYGLGYTIGFDATSAVFKAYQGFGLPTQVFIDRQGVVRTVIAGPITEIEAERVLAPLLAS